MLRRAVQVNSHEAHPAASMPEASRASRAQAVALRTPVAIHTSSSMPDLVREPKMEAMSPRQGMRNGNSAVPDAPLHASVPPMLATDAEVAGSLRAGHAEQDMHNVSDMCQAIELLHVVQQDQGWQTAERQGGSLHGGAAALLSALQSPATEATVMRANNNGRAAGAAGAAAAATAAPAPSSTSDAVSEGAGGAAPPSAPRMKRAHGGVDPMAVPQRKATPSGPSAALAAGMDAPEAAAALIGAEHRQFGFPGGGTFVRVPQQPGAAGGPGAGGIAGHASLQDKLLRADASSIGASTTGAAAAPGRGPAADPSASAVNDPAGAEAADVGGAAAGAAQSTAGKEAVFAAQPPGAWAGATAASGAGAPLAAGVSLHPSTHNSMHASIHSPLQPGSLRGSMHTGPLIGGPPLTGSGSLSAVDVSNAPIDLDPTELKALRNRVNRSDGGIGRKLTLDVLKLQFGKGLKEAAESLGMCPTTLKRACRRLGVKRWPRTPEAAAQVLAEAQEAQRAMAVAAASVPSGFVSQFGGIPGGSAYGFSMAPPGVLPGARGFDDATMAAGGDPATDAEAHMLLLDSRGAEDDNLGVGEFDDFLEMWGTD